MHILERSQLLHAACEEVWSFIETPENLDIITPADLSFRIVSPVPEEMFNGLIIEYQITVPLFGRQRWVTEIKHIREPYSFVDEQRLGPYRFWYHYHELQRYGKDTRMIDRVHYQLPFGPLGRTLHSVFIGKTLGRIFEFREAKLTEIFTQAP